MRQLAAAPSAARREASVSRRARRACLSNIVMLLVNANIGRSIKYHVKNVPPSYAMGAVQGPTTKRGLSYLLLTNAVKNDKLCLAPTRDFIICTHL